MATNSDQSFQVIAAIQPRTGTTSLLAALTILLGGPVMHGGTKLVDDSYVKGFLRAFELRRNGQREEVLKVLKQLTNGYVAAADLPPAAFVEELINL